IGSVCLSVLDFTQVVVLDYSCADEAVAKLIQRYQVPDRPADAYFVARGLGEQHRDPIDEVLIRHDLALVAEVEGEFTLLGRADELEKHTWSALQRVRSGRSLDLARAIDAAERDVRAALEQLATRRVVLQRPGADSYYSLTTLLPDADS